MMDSLQTWGFALRATTPHVAFGCDPTGRSVFFYNQTEYLKSAIRNPQSAIQNAKIP